MVVVAYQFESSLQQANSKKSDNVQRETSSCNNGFNYDRQSTHKLGGGVICTYYGRNINATSKHIFGSSNIVRSINLVLSDLSYQKCVLRLR